MVHSRNLLPHPVTGQGQIIGLVGPVVVGPHAAVLGRRTQGCQLQGRQVHEHEVSAATCIDAVEHRVHAVDVIRDGFILDLGVGDKGVVAQIIGADPDRVHRFPGWDVEEPLSRDFMLAVSQEGGHFVFQNRRERSVNGRECAWGDLVGAYGAADGVVVQVHIGVLRDIVAPDITT